MMEQPRAWWKLVQSHGWLVVLIILGLALRTELWLKNPSFWIDESMLALNLVYRTPSQCLEPLDLNQGAAVGYLLVCKYAMQAFGTSEHVPRGVSLVVGLLGWAAFAWFMFAKFDATTARLATAWFGLSPYLVSYSVEFKQYEFDAALSAVLLAVAGPSFRPSRGSVSRWLLLACSGAVAVWFSHPVVFVLFGIGCGLLYEALHRRDYPKLGLLGGATACWILSFGVAWWCFTSRLGGNDYLLSYWSGKFMPLPPRAIGDFAWIVHHLSELFQNPGGFSSPAFAGSSLAACLALIGLARLTREQPALAVALVSPMVAALAASALKKYPFAGRLLLFTVPLVLPLVTFGLLTLCEKLASLRSGLPSMLVALALLPSFHQCWLLRKEPPHPEPIRELVGTLAAIREPTEPVFVYRGAVPGYAYYAPRAGLDSSLVHLSGVPRHAAAEALTSDLASLASSRATTGTGWFRLWVVFSHGHYDDLTTIQSYVTTQGWQVDTITWGEATLLRCDRGQISANIPPADEDSRPEPAR